ncbi:MAG: glucan biosynthesis protein [Beijerinckiaceae bacterium]
MGGFAAAGMAGLGYIGDPFGPRSAAAQEQASTPQFDPETVANAARELAKRPHKPAPVTLPSPIAGMKPEAAAAIRFKHEHLVWATGDTGFAIEPIHRSRVTPGQIAIYLVEDGAIRPLTFNAAQFSYEGAVPALPPETGFAGFRILQRDDNGVLSNVCQFAAPDIYQAIGRNQVFGVVARPLSIRTADGKANDPVTIRAVWIEKPLPAQKAVVVHAIFDARPMAGVLRFTIRPGVASIIDTECTLFARTDVAEFGLGAMAATHLSGSLNTRFFDDVRPSVHDIGGLQLHTGSGEWIWRPVANGARLQISAFVDKDPRGFGLLQRDRRYDTYVDDVAKWHRRPSLWIEPIGKWGAGQVTLLEIPSSSQNNKNIGAYWRPAEAIAAGTERRFVFRQFWGWNPPDRPEGAIVTMSRHGKVRPDQTTKQRRFLVQFDGGNLFDADATPDIQASVTATPGTVSNVQVYPSKAEKAVRVLFDVEPGSSPTVELRLLLEAAQKPVSETWLYRWTL